MNKAFTVIELLAVIIILSLIVAITVPKLIKVLEGSKTKAYNITVGNIINATRYYVTENRDLYKDIDTFEIEVSDLCINKYLSCPIFNPTTEEEMTGSVNVTRIEDAFEYEYIE